MSSEYNLEESQKIDDTDYGYKTVAEVEPNLTDDNSDEIADAMSHHDDHLIPVADYHGGVYGNM